MAQSNLYPDVTGKARGLVVTQRKKQHQPSETLGIINSYNPVVYPTGFFHNEILKVTIFTLISTNLAKYVVLI